MCQFQAQELSHLWSTSVGNSHSHYGQALIVTGVCQFQAQDQSQFWSAGVGNSRLHYSEGAISLEYTDGAPCKDGLTRRTRIDFVCEMNGSERIAFIDKPNNCSFLIIWYTDVACSTKVWLQLIPLICSSWNFPLFFCFLSFLFLCASYHSFIFPPSFQVGAMLIFEFVSWFKSVLKFYGFLQSPCVICVVLAGGMFHPSWEWHCTNKPDAPHQAGSQLQGADS